jgi:hypothetical protein
VFDGRMANQRGSSPRYPLQGRTTGPLTRVPPRWYEGPSLQDNFRLDPTPEYSAGSPCRRRSSVGDPVVGAAWAPGPRAYSARSPPLRRGGSESDPAHLAAPRSPGAESCCHRGNTFRRRRQTRRAQAVPAEPRAGAPPSRTAQAPRLHATGEQSEDRPGAFVHQRYRARRGTPFGSELTEACAVVPNDDLGAHRAAQPSGREGDPGRQVPCATHARRWDQDRAAL